MTYIIIRIRICKLEISTAPTKAKWREPAYSQALQLPKTKSIGSESDPESKADRQSESDGYGGWCLEMRRGGR